MASVLDTTWNFVDIYTHAAGRWKTPAVFHRWMALALISACVEDRVQITLFEHAPLKPSLWTFFIGGSGVGKDHAIGFGLSMLESADPILVHDGKLTIPSLYDSMADHQRITARDTVSMLLVSSDLPELLPPGPEAQEFVTRALQLFGGRQRVLKDYTRTNGKREIKNPMLNWIAGCTPRWFPNSVNSEVFHGGMAGRSLFIWGEPDHKYGHFLKPILPPDYDECREHLRMRLVNFMQGVEGEMIIGVKARGVIDEWLLHHSQHRPQNDIQEAVHSRKPTLLIKLAMLMSLADWKPGSPLKLRARDVAMAIPLLSEVERGVRKVGDYIYANPETQKLERLRDYLRTKGKVSQSSVTRYMQKRGVATLKELDGMLDSMVRGGEVHFKREKQPNGHWTKFYIWLGAQGLRSLIKDVRKRDKTEGEDREQDESESTIVGDQEILAGTSDH